MRSGNVARNREILDAFDDLLSWFQRQGLLKQYHAILCRLCIDHVYLAASVRVLTEAPGILFWVNSNVTWSIIFRTTGATCILRICPGLGSWSSGF